MFSVFFVPVSISGPNAEKTVKVSKNDTAITLSCGGSKILSYHHAVHPVPEGVDPSYRRSGFIHPLYSPSGKVLTRIQPPDHYHHYGSWAPWTKTHIDGREVDFWNLGKKQGTVRFAELISKEAGGFTVHQEHVEFTDSGGERVVIDEILRIHASAAEIDGIPAWIVDVSGTLKNILDAAIIMDKYRYGGGIAIRAAKEWKAPGSNILSSEGKDRDNGRASRARWCEVFGTFDDGTRSGILFMSHPDNREHPEPIYMWDSKANGGRGDMFFQFCPIHLNPWQLNPGAEYKLRYRMVIYDGKLNTERMEILWQTFAEHQTFSE
ncbi:PmoA family protein [Limihaloglobus sulfuriphilus]|uniref:DUF6807 domain-containing protein n=1 Tax=Limihaloglobus sulfuriphilus TaxID=1851148 RepID=UPI00164A04B2|nr:PmoA family protein [Limihaloglobus sulfuriphilus]